MKSTNRKKGPTYGSLEPELGPVNRNYKKLKMVSEAVNCPVCGYTLYHPLPPLNAAELSADVTLFAVGNALMKKKGGILAQIKKAAKSHRKLFNRLVKPQIRKKRGIMVRIR